jgi:hypothetical protein
VRYSAHVHMSENESPDGVKLWFQGAIQKMWPVAEGSLSLRKTPCIRKNCAACASGEGHRNYVLYGRRGKQRVSLYVPEDLAPEVEKALENGRQLRQVINEAGLRYLHALKRKRISEARKK